MVESENVKSLLKACLEGIDKKKGIDVVISDLSKMSDTVCDYFIICHGDSEPHVRTIADSVLEVVKEQTKEIVWHKEGFENAQWILLDYANVVIHVFQKEYRHFYNLEDLWADAEILNPESI